jgi:hypothetical protein
MTLDPVSDGIGKALSMLPAGVYRSQMTVCRIVIDPASGLERASEVVLSHAVDFVVTSRGSSLALPPVEGAP